MSEVSGGKLANGGGDSTVGLVQRVDVATPTDEMRNDHRAVVASINGVGIYERVPAIDDVGLGNKSHWGRVIEAVRAASVIFKK
jgi:hypothetical protein